jgi:hypothetical protein
MSTVQSRRPYILVGNNIVVSVNEEVELRTLDPCVETARRMY